MIDMNIHGADSVPVKEYIEYRFAGQFIKTYNRLYNTNHNSLIEVMNETVGSVVSEWWNAFRDLTLDEEVEKEFIEDCKNQLQAQYNPLFSLTAEHLTRHNIPPLYYVIKKTRIESEELLNIGVTNLLRSLWLHVEAIPKNTPQSYFKLLLQTYEDNN